MVGVGKHIHRAVVHHLVFRRHALQIACLCGRVTAHIHNAAQFSLKDIVIHQAFHHFLVHAFPWRVGDDDIGNTMCPHEVGCEYGRHVAGKEFGVDDTVQFGIDTCILYGIFHIFDTYRFSRQTRHVSGYRAGSSVKVIDGVIGLYGRQIGRQAI